MKVPGNERSMERQGLLHYSLPNGLRDDDHSPASHHHVHFMVLLYSMTVYSFKYSFTNDNYAHMVSKQSRWTTQKARIYCARIQRIR